MLTIVETPTFVADADDLWSEEERLEFFAWIAANPEAGMSSQEVGVAVRFAGRSRVWVREAADGRSISSVLTQESYGCW